MRGKIFRSIWFVLFATLTVSFGLTAVFLYDHFTNEQLEQLRGETKLVSQAVTLNGQDYFDRLGSTDFRITWITSDGTILYDNEADSHFMPNHLEREEIREALESGYGESSRYSSTCLSGSFTQPRGSRMGLSCAFRSHRRRSGLCFFILYCPLP